MRGESRSPAGSATAGALLAFLGSWAALVAPVEAQDDLSRLLSGVRTGSPLAVVDHAGADTIGRLDLVGPTGIRLRLPDRVVQVPWEEIALVRRHGDPLLNGLLWGGFWGTAVAFSFVSQLDCQTCRGWEAASVLLVLGGGGAAIGGLLDHAHLDRTVLFRATPPPTADSDQDGPAGPSAPALSLSLSWRF